MIKKGDTLIEVTLAVGIFSMIAIAIVAVMSNGVANAQTALESTLAREEIDTQAEALRFIHASHISSVNESSENRRYADLWNTITDNAIKLSNTDSQAVLQYMPNDCSEELYGADAANSEHYFIINPRKLGDFTNTNEVVITNKNNSTDMFQPAVTYPRLVYGGNGSEEQNIRDNRDSLFRAEGIFILAVEDEESTVTAGTETHMAFYDFYIRTCWYGNRSSDASTISTVIRLYDPAFVTNSSSNP